ncbi:hypothetical protein VIGAN_08138100, partial [Vigna angularis var. angularis]
SFHHLKLCLSRTKQIIPLISISPFTCIKLDACHAMFISTFSVKHSRGFLSCFPLYYYCHHLRSPAHHRLTQTVTHSSPNCK